MKTIEVDCNEDAEGRSDQKDELIENFVQSSTKNRTSPARFGGDRQRRRPPIVARARSTRRRTNGRRPPDSANWARRIVV